MRNLKPDQTNAEDWSEWWLDPVKDGSPNPDPVDLAKTQACIKRTYAPEIQAQIQIKVRSQVEK